MGLINKVDMVCLSPVGYSVQGKLLSCHSYAVQRVGKSKLGIWLTNSRLGPRF